MSNPKPTNMAASVETRLKNLMRERNVAYLFLLTRYATERFLYRIGVSEYVNRFVLKGGNLFVIWQNGEGYRPTMDSDMLCFGDASEESLVKIFKSLCSMDFAREDGMEFDASSVHASSIREDTEYGGTRIVLDARLGTARIRLQFDIGIGDAITPPPCFEEFPVLLNGQSPRIKIYPMPTVIAEKLETMISRGFQNSRMKDFYDVWLLSEMFEFEYEILVKAVRNTFARRGVAIPSDPPEAFTKEFAENAVKVTQWKAFLRRQKLKNCPQEFVKVIDRIAIFLQPILNGNLNCRNWTHTHYWH